MKKTLFLICMLTLLSIVPVVQGQDVRVKCRNFTMNTTSGNVHCYQIEDNIPALMDTPEELEKAQIANTAIYFSDFGALNSSIEPQVTFYSVDDLSRASFSFLTLVMTLTDQTNNLKTGDVAVESIIEAASDIDPVTDIEEDDGELLTDGGFFTPDGLPFLPFQSSKQTVTALPAFLEFNGGSGIRTITAFDSQISANGGNSNIYYSWQGVSDDGQYYISAVFPLRSLTLDGKSASDIDWAHFDGQDLQPSLNQLDSYIRSIVIE